jgi:polygalacturonase
MASTFPTTLDAFVTNLADATPNVTTHPALHNNTNDAINKLEAFVAPAKNIKSHGAVGDGATDDSTAFQTALTAGGDVFVPPGTYVVTGLSVPTGARLRGVPGAILKHKASAATAMITIADASVGATVCDLTIDGNAANQGSNVNPIQVGGAGGTVRNVAIYDSKYDAILIRSSSSRVTVADCRIYKVNASVSTGRYGITVLGTTTGDAPTGVIIRGNHVAHTTEGGLGIVGIGFDVVFADNVTEATGGDGIAAYNRDNRRVACVGNVINGPLNNGIHVGGTDMLVSGNVVKTSSEQGIVVASDPNAQPTATVGATVTGNTVDITSGASSGAGIKVDRYTNAVITGNTVRDANTHGIVVSDCRGASCTGNTVYSPAVQGIRVEGSTEVALSGNVIFDAGTDGIRVLQITRADEVVVQSADVAITGNMISTSGGWGVLSQNTSERLRLTGNHFLTNTSGRYSLVGTNAVDDLSSREDIKNDAMKIICGNDGALDGGTTIMVDGTIYFMLEGFRAGDVVAGISFIVTSIGATMTLSKVGLYTTAGVRLAISADQTTAWESNGRKTVAFTAPYTVPANAALYLAIIGKGGTLPTVLRGGAAAAAGTAIGAGVRPIGTQTSQTDLVDPATIAGGSPFGIAAAAYHA